ncbi:phospholipase A2-like [Microplitis demolitor]|uniref:phospholipase A2-like n=1 Tax=Microplitis demolitor TaxID=69319 RepID=UPI0004CCBBA1|nr:phospholipase A2-like [Microplitis demolitor]
MFKNVFYFGLFSISIILCISEKITSNESQSFELLELHNYEENDGKIRTYKSHVEILLQDLGAILGSSNKTHFIGKSFSEVLNLFKEKVHILFPGTHWCGPGNAASDFDDLGLFNKTDSCCRTHDNCPDDILAGESLGPLINDGIFTRSSCSCDQEFFHCLKKVKSLVSTSIGDTYFNILGPQCFSLDYPIQSCVKYQKIIGKIRKKCIKYDLDESKPKELQWFDNRYF